MWRPVTYPGFAPLWGPVRPLCSFSIRAVLQSHILPGGMTKAVLQFVVSSILCAKASPICIGCTSSAKLPPILALWQGAGARAARKTADAAVTGGAAGPARARGLPASQAARQLAPDADPREVTWARFGTPVPSRLKKRPHHVAYGGDAGGGRGAHGGQWKPPMPEVKAAQRGLLRRRVPSLQVARPAGRREGVAPVASSNAGPLLEP